MPIIDEEATSLNDLMNKVLAVSDRLPDEHFLWYRGVNCHSFSTFPKLMRDGKTVDQVRDRERRLQTRFRQRSMAYWPSGYPQNNWEHLFAMQHFGIPTRLLDWSENLFVAAHFALLPEPRHHVPHDGPCIPVVWCVDPVAWNRTTHTLIGWGNSIHVMTTVDEEIKPYEPLSNMKRSSSAVAIYGAHNSNRIVAQRGTFMIWGDDTRSLEQFSVDQPASQLYRFKLTGARDVHAKALQRLGFSETMVFPELSYLADELSRLEGWKQ